VQSRSSQVVLRASKARYDKKCQKKLARGVTEQVHDINKIAVLLRAWQTSCETINYNNHTLHTYLVL